MKKSIDSEEIFAEFIDKRGKKIQRGDYIVYLLKIKEQECEKTFNGFKICEPEYQIRCSRIVKTFLDTAGFATAPDRIGIVLENGDVIFHEDNTNFYKAEK